MLISKQNFLNTLIFITTVVVLNGCSDSGSKDELDSDNIRELSVFEGESLDIEVDSNDADLTWQQTLGPTIEVEQVGDNQFAVTVPWIMSESVKAEFEVSNGDDIIDRIHLTVLDRNFLIFRVENTENDEESLFLRYMAAMNEESVPTLETVFLANTPADQDICAFSTSPSGQFVAYTIKTESDILNSGCRGIYLVDVETQVSIKVSPLDGANNDIKIRSLEWSPDGTKLAYQGAYGEGIYQHYAYDLSNNTTSYINYGNNYLATNEWPTEDIYPITDGGNSYELGLVENPTTLGLSWLENSNGVGFLVSHEDSEDTRPYIGSIQGDARLLQRGVSIADYVLTLDDEGMTELQDTLNSFDEENRGAATLTMPNFEVIIPRFYNPKQMDSSIEGHLSFIANIQLDIDSSTRVLAVNPPVIDDQTVNTVQTRIVAEQVFHAAWSPKSMQLAFSGESEERFRSDKHFEELEEMFPQIKIFGHEIPGQLYLYNNYTIDGEVSQERLAYPQPEIDDSYVRRFSWSSSGDDIAYVRGEENEGTYYYSLWLTAVDDIRDETQSTIDMNTLLLENLRDSNDYMIDFLWSPNNAGILAIVQNINDLNGSLESTSLRYYTRDGSIATDVALLNSKIHRDFNSLKLSFSPDGRYFIYEDLEDSEGATKEAIYIQSVEGGDAVKMSVPNEGITFMMTPFWSPNGDEFIFSAKIESGDPTTFYIANIQGESQPWQTFFLPEQQIRFIATD